MIVTNTGTMNTMNVNRTSLNYHIGRSLNKSQSTTTTLGKLILDQIRKPIFQLEELMDKQVRKFHCGKPV